MANLANIAAALRDTFAWWWVGFYLVEDKELVLGPFQGPITCTRIKYGKGVCGSAWQQKEILWVPDVDKFPGHIACSSLSVSEIVVPLFDKNNQVVAVLDIDSERYDVPDEVDLDTTMRLGRPRKFYEYDQNQGGRLGTRANEIMTLGRLVFSETSLIQITDVSYPEEICVDLSLKASSRRSLSPLDSLSLPSFETGSVDAVLALKKPQIIENKILYRKNLKPVSYVMSDLS